jgi:O-antigen/teichoic acid export membrane protein
LALRVLISTVIGGVVGLVLTFLHYGVWALVWQTMLQRALNVVILWRLVALPFRLGISRPHWRELWRYGGPMLLSQTMSWATAQLPRSIMGLYLGASELGLFTLGARIHEMVLQLTLSPPYAVARVELRKFLDDREGIDAAMTRLLQQMAFLCFPICIGGAVVMPVLFHVWLDARWTGGVLAAQLMLLGAMPYVTHYGLSAALLAMNRQSLIAVNSTVQAIATVGAVAIFAPFGLTPATAAIALRPLATAAIPVVYARRYCGIGAANALRAQMPLLFAALGMGATVWLLRHALAPHLGAGALLVLLIAVGAIVYAILLALFAPQLVARYRARFGLGSA